ncbi:MAG: putative peptidoglycan glycosyltransferase FtsW [Firmicutes bacterium]|nr:putative peptidoglycan glycosyltransferase FtsW [Bacillota bacterium]
MAHKSNRSNKRRSDVVKGGLSFPLLLITVTLILIGVVMVFSSTYATTVLSGYEGYKNAIQHTVVAVVCILMIVLGNRLFDYRWLNRKPIVLGAVGVCIVLLCLVFLFDARNDAHRWIEIGGITIQPSEIAKFVAVIYMAYYASHNRYWYSNIKTWICYFVPSVFFAVLIVLEPNLSTTLICIIAPAIIMAFISGLQLYWAAGIGVLAAGAGAYMMLFTDWRAGRLQAWLNPWIDPQGSSYQIVQSLYALGDGSLFGVGLGNSKQKISYLPMKDTDYIFAIIGEEFGFVGAVAVILLYAAFVIFAVKIALNAPDAFGCFLASGITAIVALQAIVNIAVVTNTIPSTGVTLPFISRGTSSLLCFSAGATILLNISRYSRRKKNAAEPQEEQRDGESRIRAVK